MSDATMLDEKALRSDTFRDDLAVILADGQTWHLRKPVVRMGIKRDDAGKASLDRRCCLDGVTPDPAYGELLRSYQDAHDAEDAEGQTTEQAEEAGERVLLSHLEIAVALLRSNYRLTLEEAGDLLALDLGDADKLIQLYRISVLGTGKTPPDLAPAPDPNAPLPEVASVEITAA